MSQGEKVSWPIINCPALHYWWNFFCLEYLGWYEGGFHVSTIPLDYRPSFFYLFFAVLNLVLFIVVCWDSLGYKLMLYIFLWVLWVSWFLLSHCRLFVSLPSRSSLFLTMKPVTICNRSLLISWVTYCSLGLTSL